MNDPITHLDFSNIKDNTDVDWQLMLYSGQRLIKDVQSAEIKPSLIIIHLLSLREINEMYSREITDKMLFAIRDFFLNIVSGAVLYRLGGGKFCLAAAESLPVAEGLAADEGLPVKTEQTAELMRRRFNDAWVIASDKDGGDFTKVYCGAEMVILSSEFIRYNTDPLLNVIERALFFTRKRNKGVLHYNSNLNLSNIRSQRFDYSLKNCVYSGMRGFNVFYQPVANPMTGIWSGVEALCRWTDPESGNVPADVFIAAAERLKLIDEIGLWVLETAVNKCKEWGLDKVDDFILEVNISSMQFTDPKLADRIISILDANSFPSLKLCFEITDGTQVVFNNETVKLMERLKDRNITFALDDFGSGYSAFTHLSQLPVDVVKIEHNFTSNIIEDSYLRHLFRAISELAHTANLLVVAEGVESVEQMRVLLENGADLLQGYLISKPLPPEEMEKMIGRFNKSEESYRFLSRRIDLSNIHRFDDEFFFTSSLNKISNQCVHVLLYEKDINVALEKTLEIVGLHINVSRAYVFQQNRKSLFDNTYEWCNEGIKPLKTKLTDMLLTEDLIDCMNTQGAIISSDIGDLPPDLHKVLEWQGIKSILLLPIWEGDQISGLVGFDDCCSNRLWRPEEVLFIQSFCLIIASVLNRVNDKNELDRLNEQRERRSNLIYATNFMLERLALPDEAPFDDAMAVSLKILAEALKVQRINVLRHLKRGVNDASSRVVLQWNSDNPGAVSKEIRYLLEETAIKQWSSELQKNVLVNKFYSEMNDDEQDFMLAYGFKSLLLVPTFISGEYWGCVSFIDVENERFFNEDDKDLMRSATRIIINAIIRSDIEAQLINESSYNRELVSTLSKREIMLSALNKTAVSFLAHSVKAFRDQLYVGMEIMSTYANINRICIWKREEVYDFPRYTLYRKWSDKKDNVSRMIDEGGILPYGPFADWDIIFKNNGYINCMIWELPETKQNIFMQYGINALLTFPVFSHEKLWGLVCFDNCGNDLYKKDEVDILRYASLMLGSVIIRDEEAAKAREAETRIQLMLNATPLSCQLWDKEAHMIDCNEAAYKLFGLNGREELAEKIPEFVPERQPDGTNSAEMGFTNLIKAFKDGVVIFDWMFKLPDGKPLPTEVTLKRVEYKGGYIVAGYTRDLRRLKLLEEEAGKIYFDPLTGIYNRRFLDENLLRIIKTLSRLGGTLSMMIVDIDRFKQYNDTYGHIQGDECLRMIAQALNGCVTRSDDFVARYGGEEFAVVLPNTDTEGAEMIAARLLEAVRAKNCEHCASDVLGIVTISVGIITGKVSITHTEKDFISGADVMLYEAKHSGRNKFCRGVL